MRKLASYGIAITLTAAVTLATIDGSAAGPLPVDTLAVKAAAPTDVVGVRYRHGGAVAAGIALGLIGAAIASQYYHYPPYPPYPPYAYYYGPPYWGPGPYFVYGAYPRHYFGSRYYRPRYRHRR
jgi:hypothetical protein